VRLLPYVIAVILLPLLVLWHQDNALFAPPRPTDPWFYLGFFRNLVNFKRDLFPGIYYGSRLAWLLPGYIVHSLFSPLAANLILHLGVHSIATLSFFSILQMTAGRRSAFLATVVFSLNPWLWCATGWDYVDGPGIAWCLLAMALLTLAAQQSAPKRSLLLAGVASAGMVHTTFFLLAFAPLLPLYYVAMARATWRQTPIARSITSFAAWAGAGFAIFTAVLCGVNYLLDGNLWFWAPSVEILKILNTTFKQPKFKLWIDGGLVPCLWFVAVAVGTALATIPSRLKYEFKGTNAAALVFSVQLLLVVSYMAYQQSRAIPGLGSYSYASFMLPFTFLVAGISFFPGVDRMTPGTYGVTCCVAALTFGGLWAYPGALPAPPVLAALVGGVLAVALALRQRVEGTWLALAGFAILGAQASGATARLHGNRAEYQRILQARDRVEHYRRGGVVRFWFDERDPASLDYFALSNSYLAEFSLISTSFPERGCDAQIDPGTLIVVSSRRPDAAETARRTLASCWQSKGMKAGIVTIDAMKREGQPYSMILLKADTDPALQHPLQVTFDSGEKVRLKPSDNPLAPLFPRDGWKVTAQPADRATVEPTAQGLMVRTPRAAYGFALEYPALTAPVAGRYRFALRYRHVSGHFAFGARSADDSRYLAADTAGRPVDGEREMSFWLNLKAGDSLLLRIANNNNSGNGAASFVMGDVTAVRVDP
jgi:hypothetical protein